MQPLKSGVPLRNKPQKTQRLAQLNLLQSAKCIASLVIIFPCANDRDDPLGLTVSVRILLTTISC